MKTAPFMGVGLGVDVFDTRPDFRKLIRRHRAGFDFLEIYTRGNWDHVDELFAQVPADVPRTYHHEGLDPVGPRLCPDAPIGGCIKNQQLLNPPWTVEELAVRHIDGLYTDFFFPAILTAESLRATVANLNALNARLPVPLLPENAPYEFVVGDMHLCEFLTGVAHGADCGLVLDLGHLWSYQLCVGHGDDPLHGIEKLDLSRVIEVHLAGARVEKYSGGRIYRDLHGAGPIPEASLLLLRDLRPSMPNLKAVTIEVENATEEGAIAQCAQVRKIVQGLGSTNLAAAPPASKMPNAGVDGTVALRTQFSNLYRLYYKRDERELFFAGGGAPVAGLDKTGLAPLRALELNRLRRVVDLHAADIGHQWYRPRVPATWLALQAVLDVPEAEVVHLLTQSDAFESRVNDDSDCRALAGFVDSLRGREAVPAWLPELLRYECRLGCPWPDDADTRVEEFAFDVSGIRESLLNDRICPTGERKRRSAMLLHRASSEVREAPLRPGDVAVLGALLAGRNPNGTARAIERARNLLRQIRR